MQLSVKRKYTDFTVPVLLIFSYEGETRVILMSYLGIWFLNNLNIARTVEINFPRDFAEVLKIYEVSSK